MFLQFKVKSKSTEAGEGRVKKENNFVDKLLHSLCSLFKGKDGFGVERTGNLTAS